MELVCTDVFVKSNVHAAMTVNADQFNSKVKESVDCYHCGSFADLAENTSVYVVQHKSVYRNIYILFKLLYTHHLNFGIFNTLRHLINHTHTNYTSYNRSKSSSSSKSCRILFPKSSVLSAIDAAGVGIRPKSLVTDRRFAV